MDLRKIISRQNPEIIALTKLHDSKGRAKQKRFLAEGIRACSTLLQSGQTLIQLYATAKYVDQAQTLTDASNITQISTSVLNKISTSSTPNGIVGVFTLPPPPQPEALSTGIVLAQISDPGNMGTLIRTCAAMGKKSVVIIEGADPWSPKVVQASAGTIGNVDLFKWTWNELQKHKQNIHLAALVVSGGKPPTETLLNNKLLVIGSEARGLPTNWQNECDVRISLTMPGKAESLNAGVAGSIAMYLAWSK